MAAAEVVVPVLEASTATMAPASHRARPTAQERTAATMAAAVVVVPALEAITATMASVSRRVRRAARERNAVTTAAAAHVETAPRDTPVLTAPVNVQRTWNVDRGVRVPQESRFGPPVAAIVFAS